MLDTLIKDAYNLRQEKKVYEDEITKAKAKITEVDLKIKDLNNQIIEQYKINNITEFMIDNIIAAYTKTTSFDYDDPKLVIAWLKKNNLSQYIRVKTTEELDKKSLKTAVKSDEDLKNNLDNLFMKEKITEILTVCDQDTYKQLQENLKKGS